MRKGERGGGGGGGLRVEKEASVEVRCERNRVNKRRGRRFKCEGRGECLLEHAC